MQNMSGVPLERFVTVRPRWLGVPGVLTLQQFCMQWLVSKHWHDQLVVPSDDWSAAEWSFSLKETCINPEVNLQAVLTLSPSEPKLDSETWGWWFIKELEAVKKSKGNKGSFMSFWFLEETRLGRSHPLSAHIWFSMSLSFLPPPRTPSSLGQFLLDPTRGETSYSGLLPDKATDGRHSSKGRVPAGSSAGLLHSMANSVHKGASCVVPLLRRSFIPKPAFSNGRVSLGKTVSHVVRVTGYVLFNQKIKIIPHQKVTHNDIKLIHSYNEFLSFAHTHLFHNY